MVFQEKAMRLFYTILLFSTCRSVSAQENEGLLISYCDVPSVSNHDSIQNILKRGFDSTWAGPTAWLIVRYKVDADANILSHRILQAPHPSFLKVPDSHIARLRFQTDPCFNGYVRNHSPKGIWVNVLFRIGYFP